MNIENLEIKLLESSKIQDGDVILVKIKDYERTKFSKDQIKDLYQKVAQMINKPNIGIYFFPADLEISLIKDLITDNILNGNIPTNENTNNNTAIN